MHTVLHYAQLIGEPIAYYLSQPYAPYVLIAIGVCGIAFALCDFVSVISYYFR